MMTSPTCLPEWSRDRQNRLNNPMVRDVDCPACGSVPGKCCTNRTGALAGKVHDGRQEAWLLHHGLTFGETLRS